MVDFQKRDTSRGIDFGDDEPDEEQAGEDATGHDDDATAHEKHDHHAHDLDTVGVAVLTVSSSRHLDADHSGDAIAEAVTDAGHELVTRELVRDDLDAVQGTIHQLVNRKDVNAVISSGGTGVSPDDVTIEAIEPLLSKDLPGFGELFRRKSAEEIGPKVIATRAAAGVADGVLVFALPGSVDAVELGVEEVILPELGHLAGLARRGSDDHEE